MEEVNELDTNPELPNQTDNQYQAPNNGGVVPNNGGVEVAPQETITKPVVAAEPALPPQTFHFLSYRIEVYPDPAKQGVARTWSLGIEDLGLPFVRACLAEFVGTALLILICVGCANSRVLTSLNPDFINLTYLYYLGISMGFAFGIGGIVHILSDASGGNVNPAVSLALFLDRRISLLRMVFYILAQFAGGFAGAGILYGLGNHGALDSISGGNSYDLDDISHVQAFFLEALGTMFLVLTILATIHEGRAHQPSYLQPFSIGVALLIMHIWLIPYTNCGINPVRGSVWNIVIGEATDKTWVFVFAPLVGSLAAVPLFNVYFSIC